jgi:nucleotide-binding universal stress UspA family protein
MSAPHFPVSHVLVGVDGSPNSHQAAEYALSLAERFGAAVTLVYVLEPPPVVPVGIFSGYVTTSPPRTPAEVERARQELRGLVAERAGATTQVLVEVGPAADTLCEVAARLKVDLLVVGARGLSASSRWLVGSVSDRVVHQAPCPVLVVRDATSGA